MGTTAGGLRYPEPTEAVAQGATAIKNLALDVDTTKATKAEAAAKVAKAGDTMTGMLNMDRAGAVAIQVNSDGMSGGGATLRGDGVFRILTNTVNNAGLRVGRGEGSGTLDPGQTFISFVRGLSPGGTTIGSIDIATSSSVAYKTTSDARLKTPTGDAADAADIVQALGAKVYRGRWIADGDAGEEWILVNSQDVEPVAPFAVWGAGDAVATAEDVAAERAGEAGEIVPQQLDHGALVPLLLAALSQALDRIAALEAAP